MATKEYLQQIANFDRTNRAKDVELFRDRAPIEPTSEEVEAERAGTDPDAVSSTLVREVLLGAIGNLQAKVRSDRFNNMDAQQLEKLLELVKDWPALQKAVDTLQAWGQQQEAVKAAMTKTTAPTSDKVRKLRAVLDILPDPPPK